jgi:hypothetical protein
MRKWLSAVAVAAVVLIAAAAAVAIAVAIAAAAAAVVSIASSAGVEVVDRKLMRVLVPLSIVHAGHGHGMVPGTARGIGRRPTRDIAQRLEEEAIVALAATTVTAVTAITAAGRAVLSGTASVAMPQMRCSMPRSVRLWLL